MKKYLQNRIAESILTLPSAAVVTLLAWVAVGLFVHQLWIQLGSMVCTSLVMIELSNSNVLLRVRSRMVTTTFLLLSTACSFLFSSLSGGIVSLCFVCSLYLLFHTYQAPSAVRPTYYAYLIVSLSSFFIVQTLYFVPLFWLLSLTQLQSLRFRTWMASLLGLVTPYWFIIPWLLYQKSFQPLTDHFYELWSFQEPFDFSLIGIQPLCSFIFINLLAIAALIHFLTHAFEDRIRVRQLYGFFIWTGFTASLVLIAQPQFYDLLLRIIIICASPLIAHFFTFTHSRFTNVLFIVSLTLVTVLILWNALFPGYILP